MRQQIEVIGENLVRHGSPMICCTVDRKCTTNCAAIYTYRDNHKLLIQLDCTSQGLTYEVIDG